MATKETVYKKYIDARIETISQCGGGVWNFKDLAIELDLTPNHNLRRHLMRLEREGHLRITYGITGKHSTCYLYHIFESDEAWTPVDYSNIPF